MTNFKENVKWALIFVFLVIISLFFILFHKITLKEANTAQIIQDGNVIRTVNLQNVNAPYDFEVVSPDGGHNIIRVENGKIGIVSADCPDKICVHQGFIDSGALPIVCLPNKLSIIISDKNSDLDAVAGGL